MNNPFTLRFIEKPKQYIERIKEKDLIIEDFISSKPSSRIYMLTGIRGSGKTVLMTSIAYTLKNEHNFYHVELNVSSKDLIMTGLYKNIEELQNNKALTFLYRSERIYLEPLDYISTIKKYNEIFLDLDLSKKMGELTLGYPFAFQTSGYLVYKDKSKDINNVIEEYKYRLNEYSYRKIYEELTNIEKEIVKIVAFNNNVTTKEVANKIKKETNLISNYKRVLIKKGIIKNIYKDFKFLLPLFDEYIRNINGYF